MTDKPPLRRQLEEKGYLVLPGVVPPTLCEAVVTDIENHLRGGDDYNCSSPDAYGWVEMYHYQSMWNVRQYPDLYAAFNLLFGDAKLWVSIDRVNRKAPLDECEEGHSFIHWDANPNVRPVRPFEVQGLVALTDTDENMGGFRCLPDLYRSLDVWLAGQPCGRAPHPFLRKPYPYGPFEKVPMRAGDLLVWDSLLPHGNGPNRGERTRYAQYVTMRPAGPEWERKDRVRCFDGRLPPSGWAFPGDPRGLEESQPLASLTRLGRKLLGLEDW